VQKTLIAEARAAGKPVITATDMLDSMRNSPRPTRAEASDVSNAILDGTDAVMLSGETAVGNYPVEAVECMHRIAVETEAHIEQSGLEFGGDAVAPKAHLEDPVVHAACGLAAEVRAAALIAPTRSGRTARLAARRRPWPRIVAVSPSEAVVRQLALVWGIAGVLGTPETPGRDRLAAAVADAFRAGLVAAGERVVVLAGHPVDGGPLFPTLRVVRVGPEGASQEP
jgi:pyruvate kinase